MAKLRDRLDRLRLGPSRNEMGLMWRTCHSNVTVCQGKLCDWANTDNDFCPQNLVTGLWTMDNITYQRDLWKMVAAMDYITVGKENVMVQPQRGVISGSGSSWNVSVSACVPEPYALLLGNFSISLDNETGITSIACNNCSLTNCINGTTPSLLILYQPVFVLLPVNTTQEWYSDWGLLCFRQ